jgi:hypothetical protein
MYVWSRVTRISNFHLSGKKALADAALFQSNLFEPLIVAGDLGQVG